MAVRSATRTYPTIRAFLEDWRSTLRVGALTLPPGSIDGDPAPDMKVDLVLPLVGRVGPVLTQLIQHLPDGTVALRISEWPPEVKAGMQVVFDTAEDLKQFFVTTGQLQAPNGGVNAEIAALRAQVAELASRPATVVRVQAASPGGSAAATRSAAAGEEVVVERGLPLPDLTGLAPILSGKLGDRTLRDALMELAIERVTGLLEVRYPDGRARWGFVHKGGPVAWRSDPIVEDEVLGILMFRASQITREQLEQSLNLMEQNGIRQGEALIEMGAITFAQLVMLLQKQCEFVFQRVIRDTEGTWTFHALDDLPERFISPALRVPSLLFRALRTYSKEMPAEELATTLRPWLDKYVYWVAGAQRVLDEMKTNSEETGFFKIIGMTSYRLRELFAVSNIARSATAGTVWTLADLHLIEFRDDEAGARNVERLRRVLADRGSAVVKGTLFDRLDLHWICNSDEVEKAWTRLSGEYGNTSYAKWGPENQTAVEAIHKSSKEAYERLRGDAKRREYRAEIMEKMQIEQSAEMLSKKGDMAIMKESRREAMDCFVKACELVPGNVEYQSGLARVRAMPSG